MKSNVQRQRKTDAETAELLKVFDNVRTDEMRLVHCISHLIGIFEMEQDPSRRDQSLGFASTENLPPVQAP